MFSTEAEYNVITTLRHADTADGFSDVENLKEEDKLGESVTELEAPPRL